MELFKSPDYLHFIDTGWGLRSQPFPGHFGKMPSSPPPPSSFTCSLAVWAHAEAARGEKNSSGRCTLDSVNNWGFIYCWGINTCWHFYYCSGTCMHHFPWLLLANRVAAWAIWQRENVISLQILFLIIRDLEFQSKRLKLCK